MSRWGLQVEAFQSQTLCLASLAATHWLFSTSLLPSSLLPFLQRVGGGLSACTLDSFFPP